MISSVGFQAEGTDLMSVVLGAKFVESTVTSRPTLDLGINVDCFLLHRMDVLTLKPMSNFRLMGLVRI